MSPKNGNVSVIFEFSNTIKHPVETHDLNLYFSKDINRWKPLDILRKQLGVPLYILIWSDKKRLIKIHKFQEITNAGLNFAKTELLE